MVVLEITLRRMHKIYSMVVSTIMERRSCIAGSLSIKWSCRCNASMVATTQFTTCAGKAGVVYLCSTLYNGDAMATLPPILQEAATYLRENEDWPFPLLDELQFHSKEAALFQLETYLAKIGGSGYREIAEQFEITPRAAVARVRKIRDYFIWWLTSGWPSAPDSRKQAVEVLMQQGLSEQQARWFLAFGREAQVQWSDSTIDAKIKELREQKLSLTEIAKKVGLDRSTICRRLQRMAR
jgi:hypothetical protein